VSCIEQEAHQKDDTEDDGENGAYGIGNVIDGILDTANLCQNGTGNK
tara:strand:+ start:813 stop:953 length:141 start_codon:yes stop_codon:yes gene_type:complete